MATLPHSPNHRPHFCVAANKWLPPRQKKNPLGALPADFYEKSKHIPIIRLQKTGVQSDMIVGIPMEDRSVVKRRVVK